MSEAFAGALLVAVMLMGAQPHRRSAGEGHLGERVCGLDALPVIRSSLMIFRPFETMAKKL